MSINKIIGIVAIVGVIGIILLFLLIYLQVKTKTKNLKNYEPFKEWIGKTVTLNNDVTIFEAKDVISYYNNKYPYTLIDDRHPNWESILSSLEANRVIKLKEFPKGTQLKIEKAIQYTGGVSGSSDPVVFGTITDNGTEYKVGYQWGKKSFDKSYFQEKKCWHFHQAPWQNEVDTAFYEIPDATILYFIH